MQNISKIDSVTQVFSYLEDPDVVSVASVCLQWAGQYHWWKSILIFSWMRDCGIKHYCQRQSWASGWFFGPATSVGVCQRVARCRCSENIPDDILTEILAQQVVIRNTENFVILELFEKWTLSTLSKTTSQAWGDVDWVAVWEAWVGSGLLPEATPFQEKGEEQRCLLPWFSI